MAAATLALLLWLQSAIPDHLKEPAALVTGGKFEQAAQKLATMDQSLPGVLHLAGVVDYNLRDYGNAVEKLTRAVNVEAKDTPAYGESVLLIGQSYFLLGKHGEAAPWLEKARTAGSQASELDYMRGVSYVHLTQQDAAIQAFAAMFHVPPNSAAALLLTAQMMFRLEYLEQAEVLLRKALTLDAKLPGVHQLLGEIANFRNDTERAISELTQELKLNPNSSVAYYKLGDAYTRREDWAEAIPALQKSVWLNPYSSGPYILLGKAYWKREQFANAEGMLRRALQLDPQNVAAQYILGQALIRMGHVEEGRELVKKSQQSKSR